ncbi:MAG: hypothetical protein HYS13_23445 [Planctomycetia bacterium]|nr:hypothetical protein [Planctomycetia bacterium]
MAGGDKRVAFLGEHWGDLASVAGLAVSLIGFWLAVRAAWAAARAATDAKDLLTRYDCILEVSQALSAMEEIKRLMRDKAWTLVPDRCTVICQSLISGRVGFGRFSIEDDAALTGIIQQFQGIREKVERANVSGKYPAVANIIALVSKQSDELRAILVRLRSRAH